MTMLWMPQSRQVVDRRPRIGPQRPSSQFACFIVAAGVMNVLIAGDATTRRTNVKTFTIENETSNIVIHACSREAEAVPDAERRRSCGLRSRRQRARHIRAQDHGGAAPGYSAACVSAGAASRGSERTGAAGRGPCSVIQERSFSVSRSDLCESL
jgi:hypothetical protein